MENRFFEYSCGIYSHPSVAKFIYWVLTTQETYTKGKQVQEWIHRGFGFGSATGGFGSIENDGSNQSFGFGASSSPPPPPSQQQQQQQQQQSQHHGVCGFKVDPQQVYTYNNEEIEERKKNIFSTSVYFSPLDSSTGTPRILFFTSRPSSRVEIPKGYTKQDDHVILKKYILGLKTLPEIVQKGGNNQLLFDFHLFLSGFELLLKDYLIPLLSNDKSCLPSTIATFNRMIDIPVLIAFGNEFDNTRFSFLNYVLADKGSKESGKIEDDIKILENYKQKLNKNNITSNLLMTNPNINHQKLEQFLNGINIENLSNLYQNYNYV